MTLNVQMMNVLNSVYSGGNRRHYLLIMTARNDNAVPLSLDGIITCLVTLGNQLPSVKVLAIPE